MTADDETWLYYALLTRECDYSHFAYDWEPSITIDVVGRAEACRHCCFRGGGRHRAVTIGGSADYGTPPPTRWLTGSRDFPTFNSVAATDFLLKFPRWSDGDVMCCFRCAVHAYYKILILLSIINGLCLCGG